VEVACVVLTQRVPSDQTKKHCVTAAGVVGVPPAVYVGGTTVVQLVLVIVGFAALAGVGLITAKKGTARAAVKKCSRIFLLPYVLRRQPGLNISIPPAML